jgi:hypothetical protein
MSLHGTIVVKPQHRQQFIISECLSRHITNKKLCIADADGMLSERRDTVVHPFTGPLVHLFPRLDVWAGEQRDRLRAEIKTLVGLWLGNAFREGRGRMFALVFPNWRGGCLKVFSWYCPDFRLLPSGSTFRFSHTSGVTEPDSNVILTNIGIAFYANHDGQ